MSGWFSDLPLEWWEREEACKDAKAAHMKRVDGVCHSREDLVLLTTLWDSDIVLEPNMFPCECFFALCISTLSIHLLCLFVCPLAADLTPFGVEHFTLWSIDDLSHKEVGRVCMTMSWCCIHGVVV